MGRSRYIVMVKALLKAMILAAQAVAHRNRNLLKGTALVPTPRSVQPPLPPNPENGRPPVDMTTFKPDPDTTSFEHVDPSAQYREVVSALPATVRHTVEELNGMQVEDIKGSKRRRSSSLEGTKEGSFMYSTTRKLKRSKQFCKQWCLAGKRDRITSWEKVYHHAINQLDNVTNGTPETGVIDQYSHALDDIRLTLQDLAQYWKQRSKLRWNTLGDIMTKYFFHQAKERTIRNRIRGCKTTDG
ncbi:hypothetical protein Cgig2_023074 [Carnegiea gigantea]|uniref:Uncharacterized protein n=1 Tax=Carnegiea gigantea TaxID=171969 RepID=A0A9Q1JYC0_9CARY|nr:hypothetical protein Cgig2_023074 [Carnegiea gigantea]